MKVQLQSEAAECGLACLAMIASHHGHGIGVAELRRQYPLSLKGTRLLQLVQISRRLGLRPRPLRLEPAALDRLSLPCILHWNLDHFVVLRAVRGGHATLIDPAHGEVTVTPEEVSRAFTGVALELAPDAGFEARQAGRPASVRELTGGISGAWPALARLLLLSIVLQLVVLASPWYLQGVLDQVLPTHDGDLLALLAMTFATLLLLQVGIGQLRGWMVIHLSSRLNQQWTGNIFSHLLRLPLDFFEKRHLGDITSRLGSLQSIKRTLTTSFVEAVMDGLLVVVTLAMMMAYSPALAMVTLATSALYLLLRRFGYQRLRDATESQLVESSRQQGYLLETLRGMQSLKVAGGEPLRHARFENLVATTTRQDARLARLNLGFSGSSQVLFGLERVLVIWLGTTLALRGDLTLGMMIAYLAYKDQFAARMAGLVDKWVEFRMLRLHGERLADIVLAPPEQDVARDAVALPERIGIVVEDLSFRYAEDEPWVLRHCSFRIAPGESVAIVGASGCGKSTLLKLMLGLLQPTEGRVIAGGFDLAELPVEQYRAVVGAVMQDDKLFAGSIADNIAFFDDAIAPGQVEAAARMASIAAEIEAMPMAYLSLIGDMGSSLSGGQQQRIILARALCRQPRLLFLDEATSHLDVKREGEVNAAIRRMPLTRVIVAHRPETIASADRVLEMEAGRIIAERPRPGPARDAPEPATVA